MVDKVALEEVHKLAMRDYCVNFCQGCGKYDDVTYLDDAVDYKTLNQIACWRSQYH